MVIAGEITALGDELPDDLVDVFDRALFPGMIRVAEVNRDVQQ